MPVSTRSSGSPKNIKNILENFVKMYVHDEIKQESTNIFDLSHNKIHQEQQTNVGFVKYYENFIK